MWDIETLGHNLPAPGTRAISVPLMGIRFSPIESRR